MTLWHIIATAFLLLIVYALISGYREQKRLERLRVQVLPEQADITIRLDMRYQVRMSDGQIFNNVAIIGQICSEDNPFGGWDGLLVLRFADNRRAFVRQGSVRCIVEMEAA
ncbi:hypothetical protein [Kingella sp. (in: b-proteobacteria)]|uniref:hypothetical protein n=1 Tax=Kingella sp. (in: b-proteobacteria) TaxID=2020713 RepID=UPI0026DAEC92|nr:hypothetical protein [Kingella sp. (in: b-proteobacteria)]MDO4657870.1 hypothetical protein [Kingella sp. (in: b-proteobacteria)]